MFLNRPLALSLYHRTWSTAGLSPHRAHPPAADPAGSLSVAIRPFHSNLARAAFGNRFHPRHTLGRAGRSVAGDSIDHQGRRRDYEVMNLRRAASALLQPAFEDEHFLFVRKPAGLGVQAGAGTGEIAVAAAPGSVVQALDVLGMGVGYDLQICYPLSTDASGVLALAKGKEARKRFAGMVEAGEVQWQYMFVTKGAFKIRRVKLDGLRAGTSENSRKSDSSNPTFNLKLLAQFDTRALVCCTSGTRVGTELCRRLANAGSPVLGDPRFDPHHDRHRSGRIFMHLESLVFEHPFSNRRVRVVWPVPPAFEQAAHGSDTLTEQLNTALAARMPCLLDSETDSFRLLSGKADGVPGLVADKLGSVVLLQFQEGKFEGGSARVAKAAEWYGQALPVRGAYLKKFVRNRSRPRPEVQRALTDPKPIWGEASDQEVRIRENGLTFLVRPYDGYSVGLFLDHRENRRRIRALSNDKRVLNAFAYTCGFSVAAAAGGAKSTVNVDISKKALEWGKRNFHANNISLANHKFYCSDLFEYVKRGRRQGHRFDLIILDPPTFSRTKKPASVFQITKDLARAVAATLELLVPNGLLLVSTNARTVTLSWLKEQIAAASRRSTVLETPRPPVDFSSDRDCAKSLIVRFQ